MNLITIKSFDNAIEAHNLRNRLEVEGIEAFIYDEHLIGLNPLYSNAIGGVKVKITDSDIEKASLVLKAIDENQYIENETDVLICPNCQSNDINTNYRDFKNVGGFLSFLVSIVFTVYPIFFKRKCKCNSCNFEFKRDN